MGDFSVEERDRIEKLVADSPLKSEEAKRALAEGVVMGDRFVGQLRMRETVRTDELRALGTIERNRQRALDALKLTAPPPPPNPFDDPDEDEAPAPAHVETSPLAPAAKAPESSDDKYAIDPKELEEDLTS